ncbi:DoxX family protein [Streptomyces liangshanensis]|uniref:DoxX family protein n=1 Tax=Streptomyces liangshanensis TaxID=2717324 RepID=A0A6G9H0A4_9ACTN|nr:DoxX family protein [Streptomyces liangshanensis]QIQ03719.1 DoxX family protein [Streptomyces liangshanensis]
MNITLWIVASLLALLFLASGAGKALQPKPKVVESSGAWAEDFSPAALKFIGVVEVLGALGLILPAALDIAPVLVPLAATGLAVVMAIAAVVHGRRAETRHVVFNVVLVIVAALVAWGRFGPYSF